MQKRIPTNHYEALVMLKKRDSLIVANNTRLLRHPDGTITLRYHRTDIVTYLPDGNLQLRTGGWQTSTTKDRLNLALGARGNILQSNHVWYYYQSISFNPDYRYHTNRVEFTNGMIV